MYIYNYINIITCIYIYRCKMMYNDVWCIMMCNIVDDVLYNDA